MQIINKTIGICLFVYNFYLVYNGIKEFAVIRDESVYKNIDKTAKVKQLGKHLKKQRCLSRKYERLKQQNKKEKGEATRQNIQKQIVKVQKPHYRIENIRTDYINKCISELVKNKLVYVTMED